MGASLCAAAFSSMAIIWEQASGTVLQFSLVWPSYGSKPLCCSFLCSMAIIWSKLLALCRSFLYSMAIIWEQASGTVLQLFFLSFFFIFLKSLLLACSTHTYPPGSRLGTRLGTGGILFDKHIYKSEQLY